MFGRPAPQFTAESAHSRPRFARPGLGARRFADPATRAVVVDPVFVSGPVSQIGGRAFISGRAFVGGAVVADPVYVDPVASGVFFGGAVYGSGFYGAAVVGTPVIRAGFYSYTPPVLVAAPLGWNCGWHGAPVVYAGPPVWIRTVRYVWDDTPFVPVAEPFVQFGATVSLWDHGAGAVLDYGNREVIVQSDTPEMVFVDDGIAYPEYCEQAPRLYQDRLYVPVEPVASGLGLSVVADTGDVTVGAGVFFATMW